MRLDLSTDAELRRRSMLLFMPMHVQRFLTVPSDASAAPNVGVNVVNAETASVTPAQDFHRNAYVQGYQHTPATTMEAVPQVGALGSCGAPITVRGGLSGLPHARLSCPYRKPGTLQYLIPPLLIPHAGISG